MNFLAEVDVEQRTPLLGGCSLLADCVIEEGDLGDYMAMSHWHYRNTMRPPGLRKIYRARYVPDGSIVGAVVFAAPSLCLAARNVAVPGRYDFGVGTALVRALVAKRVNTEIDLLMRIIVHPVFRSIGLAVKMVRTVLPLRPYVFVEASAAMGAVNRFFVKAGMREYMAPPSEVSSKILGVLRSVGTPEEVVANPTQLIKAIAALPPASRAFVEKHLLDYERKWMRVRTGRKLTITLDGAAARVACNALIRPRYYLWRNEGLIPAS